MKQVYRVFFDYCCPYCYLGKAFLQHVQKEKDFDLEFIPVEIHPEAPTDGFTIPELFPDVNFPERAQKLNDLGAPLNITIGKHLFVPNTRLALAATEYAKDQHLGTEFVNAVFEANFTEKRNISHLDILLDIAKKVGLNETELQSKLEQNTYESRLKAYFNEGLEKQVDLVPTVFLNNQKFLEGVLTLEQVQAAYKA